MADLSTVYEVLEFAIDRESEANQFYLALAEHVADENIRSMFLELAEEELEHKSRIELELIKEGKTTDLDRKVPDFKIPELVGLDTVDEPKADISYQEALTIAIQKEDTAVRVYYSLSRVVDDPASREVLLALIQEEAKHKLRFELEYNKLMSKGG